MRSAGWSVHLPDAASGDSATTLGQDDSFGVEPIENVRMLIKKSPPNMFREFFRPLRLP